jgi:alcohol dehydrogenase
MKALVYHGPGKRALEEKIKPVINNMTDAIVKITNTTICGTDLHIIKGKMPAVKSGRTLGHEGVGIIEQSGAGVSNFSAGDHVLISCITSCGKCLNCRQGFYSHCENGGWMLGNFIDGTQAEYVLIPHADNSLYHIPGGSDEEALVMLSDIMPTGFECGVLKGRVKPGDIVAIVGAGPLGLAALAAARLYSPAAIIIIDIDDNRLDIAKKFGATFVINNMDGKASEKVMVFTSGRGVDVAIEAVGISVTFDICQMIVAAGGHIANIGVHGKPVQLNLDKLWSRNITLTTHLVDTVTIPALLNIFASGKLLLKQFITHRFSLNDVMQAYDTSSNSMKENALKVIITNDNY